MRIAPLLVRMEGRRDRTPVPAALLRRGIESACLIRVGFSAYGVEKVFHKLFTSQLRLSGRAKTGVV
jgi:hypothetical protein